jgi:diguanylate cyclase (GGDEF)-like protein
VLVNPLGQKAMSVTVQELAMQMRRGSAVAEDIANMALIDRGTYRMLRSLHEQLAISASHDQLTALLTRKEFEARVDEAITEAVRTASCHVMYALDLEGFKPIVKKAGKKVGKELLKKLAKMLEKQVAHRGAVARLGASRFAVLLNNTSLEEGRVTVERQRKTIAKTRCMWRSEVFPLTASAGLLEITSMSGGVEATINAAECALQRAADAGGDRIEITGTVDEPMDTDGILAAGESTILDMLATESLRLRCQKVIPLAEKGAALPHYEILLGVQKGDGHVQLPADFLRAAERNHQMRMVDRWVISSVIAWMDENKDKIEEVDGYSINLSADSLNDEGVLAFVIEKFSETMVPPAKIIFEFKESAANDNISLITDFVTTLKTYGCRFAIDDFGMADNSFSYLNSLPVDFVKIDGKIVADILSSAKDLSVVRSINEIGHLLGKQTIAEFVENDKILAHVRDLGIDYAQGYGIEKPILLASL